MSCQLHVPAALFPGRIDLKKLVSEVWIDSSGSGYCSVAGSCEHGNETSGCIKGG